MANPVGLLGGGDTRPHDPATFGPDELIRGWDGFVNGWFMLNMASVLVLAVVLGAVIAYHPSVRRKASTIDDLDQPKTFLMYALVGALVALVVEVNSIMGLVIFGIGGLLRFRTNVGEAKDTGRVILAAVIGICCGLKLIVVAVLATAFGFVLIAYLEGQTAGRMLVKGLSREAIPKAAEAYRALLTSAGCKILGERKKFTKGSVTFVFRAPSHLDREEMEHKFESAVPEPIRGSVDWDLA